MSKCLCVTLWHDDWHHSSLSCWHQCCPAPWPQSGVSCLPSISGEHTTTCYLPEDVKSLHHVSQCLSMSPDETLLSFSWWRWFQVEDFRAVQLNDLAYSGGDTDCLGFVPNNYFHLEEKTIYKLKTVTEISVYLQIYRTIPFLSAMNGSR